MDRSVNPANDPAPRRASEWLIAIGERPRDGALRARLDSWLAASAENRRAWEEINGTWEALGRLAPARPRSRARVLAGCIAASIALFFVVGWGADTLRRLSSDHVTGVAELRSLKLEDGSDVSLAARTMLDVVYTDGERRIRLREGEAFFIVAPGDRRPFIVEAGGLEARDIGTAFDVKTGTEATEVAVQEGIVEVTTPKSGLPVERLQAGASLRIDSAGGRRRGQLAASQIAVWRQSQLVIDSQSVEAVVDSIRPYFSGTVIVRGDRFARQPLTGVYNLADPIAALRAVAAAQGASVHRLSPWLVVLNGN
jgi:transmembrane sensor